MLTRRLRTLEREGVVTRSAGRYRLTASGAELAQVCTALGTWGARWRESRPEHHDPYLALWSLIGLPMNGPTEWTLDEEVPLGAPSIYRNIRRWLSSIGIEPTGIEPTGVEKNESLAGLLIVRSRSAPDGVCR